MLRNLLVLLLIVLATSLRADEKSDVEHIREAMSKAVEGHAPDSIRPSPVPGLYEVAFGPQFFYVSADGRYAISGDLVDLQQRTNLSEERRAEMNLETVKKLQARIDKVSQDAIVYPANGQRKHFVTVFTDVDCGYCRKLHSGMKEMNDLGIEVRYLAYPRAGIGSPSYNKAVSVWCAKEQRKAMDLAKSGSEPKPAKCANSVAEQYALGQALGVQGTPAILLDDGRMIPGYVPPQRLAQILESK